jgi:hypothetical protein
MKTMFEVISIYTHVAIITIFLRVAKIFRNHPTYNNGLHFGTEIKWEN